MKLNTFSLFVVLIISPGFLMGESDLKEAIDLSDLARIEALTEQGVNLNKAMGGSSSALMYAVKRGRYQMVRFLLEHQVDMNRKGVNGRTPLMQAIIQRDKGIAVLLLQYHPDINAGDDTEMTALYHAVISGQNAMVKLLLVAGADSRKKDKFGNQPIQFAGFLVQNEIMETLRYYQETGHVQGLDQPEIQILLALESGDPELLSITFTASEVITWMNNKGTDPVSVAAAFGNETSLHYLIQDFKEMSAYEKCTEDTPLIAAVKEGRLSVVRTLLRNGADVNGVSTIGKTPLSESLNDRTVFGVLMKAGASTLYDKVAKSAVVIKPQKRTFKKIKRRKALLDKKYSKTLNGRKTSKMYRKNRNECRDPSLPVMVGEPNVVPPEFTFRANPDYPAGGVKARIRGYVILSAILGKDGKIREITVIRTLQDWAFGFEKNSVMALKKWKYIPGTLDGKPTDVSMTLKIDYILR